MKFIDIPKSEETVKCRNQALVYLGMREHNRHELSEKLKAKGYGCETVNAVLAGLEDSNALSEERYVHDFVRSSNKRHPEGKRMLSQRLAAKGADRAVFTRILDEIYTDEYTKSLIERSRSILDGKGVVRTDEEMRFALGRLGFSPSDIGSCE